VTVLFHKSSLFITDYTLMIIYNINRHIDFLNPCSTRIIVGPLYGNEWTQETSNRYKLTISITCVSGTDIAILHAKCTEWNLDPVE